MAKENVHNYEIEVTDEHSNTLKEIIRGWKDHKSDFEGDLRQLEKDRNNKIYIGDSVFQKKDGNYILRKSSKPY